MRFLPLLLPAALLLPMSATAQKINDVILKKDGARVRGVEVTEFLQSGVRGKRGEEDFELPSHQVQDIEWSEPPAEFLAGKAAMDRGDFQNAAQLFGAVQSERELVRTDAAFYQLKAAVAGIGSDRAAATAAAELATSWIGANGNHWRIPEAMLLAGRAQRLAGTAGTAATTLKQLDDRAVTDSFGTVWSARAKFELALTLLADGKASEARTQFKSASSVAEAALATSTPDKGELERLKTRARVGEGDTYMVEKDYTRAESFFRSLSSDSDTAIAAAGHAGMGEALFLSAAGDANKLRQAQMSLARAATMDPSAGEASAKANYYLGLCLLELGQAKEGDTFKDRAKAYFEICYSAYPTSSWAGLAKAAASK